MPRPRTWIALLTALLALTACSESDLVLHSDDPANTGPDQVVRLALDDLESYWSRELPALYGVAFEDLARQMPYGPRTEVPQCGPVPLAYEDVAENALYCPEEDILAWDRVNLVPDLQENFGALTVGVVMAHEFAHAIQARAGVSGQTVTLELQADCFAGAWVADVAGRVAVFDASSDELDDAIGGFLELRDTLGVSAQDPQAHGSGFDRVSAFQDGYEQGNDVCVGYEDDPPPVVAIPFTTIGDLQREGNLPIDQLLEPLVADLESFYGALFEDLGERWDPIDELADVDATTDRVSCGGERVPADDLDDAGFYCAAADAIYLDSTELVPTLEEIGDFAFGGEIARQYAVAAQHRLGLFGPGEGELHADCFTGVYAAAEFTQQIPDQQLTLSPGDLDEIMIAFLSVQDHDDTSAFERTAAFRGGFVDGVAACDRYT